MFDTYDYLFDNVDIESDPYKSGTANINSTNKKNRDITVMRKLLADREMKQQKLANNIGNGFDKIVEDAKKKNEEIKLAKEQREKEQKDFMTPMNASKIANTHFEEQDMEIDDTVKKLFE